MISNDLALSAEKINIFVAYTKTERIIGYKNDLPWKRLLKGDLNFLMTMTSNNKTAIILGRKTFESMPKPLPNRLNIILSSNVNYLESTPYAENPLIKHFICFHDVIEFCKKEGYNIAVFGGSSVYKEALTHNYKLFCTVVEDKDFLGDTYFPNYDCKLTNISGSVNELLEKRNIKKSWDFVDSGFVENNISYKFFMGEKKI